MSNKKRYLVIWDIHGRTIWKDIIEKENPDKVIFLGYYVSTHEGIPADQQLSNLEDILNYKEENPDKVILLRGNHDTQHLGYYWAECSGYDREVAFGMSSAEFLMRFTKLTDWVYIDDELKTIFSHAGVSRVWMEEILKESDVHNIKKKSVNRVLEGYKQLNGFDIPWDERKKLNDYDANGFM